MAGGPGISVTRAVCPPDHRHGETMTCYGEHRCRCASCLEGNARRKREWRLRRRSRRVELVARHHVDVDGLPLLGTKKAVCAICEKQPVPFGRRDCEDCVEATMNIWREDQANGGG